ncbi:MAG: tetratricopeptide repeat protein [Candidatus Eisenbacteria bacterium]
MRARKRRARRDLAPGRTRAVVLFISVLALLFAKFAFSAEAWPEDDFASDSTAATAAASDTSAAQPTPMAAGDGGNNAAADSLIRTARLLADEKRFDAAADDLRQALVIRPGDTTAWSLLARVLAWDRRYDASIATYHELLAAHPDATFDRAGYARVLSWSGDLPGAAMEYRRLLRANRSDVYAWLGQATIARWRGAATAADRDAAKAAALGADAEALAEERHAIDRALAPATTLGVTTSHELQRASGAPDFTIEETGPFGAARATLGRSVGVGARVARTRLFERNTRTAPGDTTLNYDLESRSLRLDASFLRGHPFQASVAGEWRSFDARSAKVLYPRNGGDAFTGWNARVWGYAGRWTPGITARRTFLSLKDWHAPTGTLRFEPGHLTDVEGTLGYQWNARGTALLAATRGETSDDNRRWRSGGTVGYRVHIGRPSVRLDYGLTFADWDRRSPSYFTPLASTRHAGGLSLSGYAEPGDVDYGARYELSRLVSSNFDDIVAHSMSGYLNGTIAERFPLGLEASYSVDNNDYETWYVGLTGSARW